MSRDIPLAFISLGACRVKLNRRFFSIYLSLSHNITVLYFTTTQNGFFSFKLSRTLSFTFIFNLALILHNKVFKKNVARVLYLYGTIDMGLYVLLLISLRGVGDTTGVIL